MSQYPLRVGILGCGTVGQYVAERLASWERHNPLGLPEFTVAGVAVRDLTAARGSVPNSLLTTDVARVATASDVVIELMGGVNPATELMLEALASGTDVVTANKAALAHHFSDLCDAAVAGGARLRFEGAVAGVIPVIRPLIHNLSGDTVSAIGGVLNGTANYVLDRMSRERLDYADALAAAQDAGYAEADPTADVDGHDAVAKLCILTRLAFGAPVAPDTVDRAGISAVSAADIEHAQAMGMRIKLIASARLSRGDVGDTVDMGVHPTLVPVEHPLAQVAGAQNAVSITAEMAGTITLAGAGAGGPETASAVLGDVVELLRTRNGQARGRVHSTHAAHRAGPIPTVLDPDASHSAWFVRLRVRDVPGALALVAGCFGAHHVSLDVVRQLPAKHSGATGHDSTTAWAELTVRTHEVLGKDFARALDALPGLPDVDAVCSVLKVQG